MILTLYFDGACEPKNPGGVATYGWLIKETAVIASGYGTVCRGPRATNNRAEWCALGLGLKWLVSNPRTVTKLLIRGDSQLVIEQLNKNWKCKAPHLVLLRDRCHHILESMECDWDAQWIPREQNHEADSLSRKAYMESTGLPFPERRRTNA